MSSGGGAGDAVEMHGAALDDEKKRVRCRIKKSSSSEEKKVTSINDGHDAEMKWYNCTKGTQLKIEELQKILEEQQKASNSFGSSRFKILEEQQKTSNSAISSEQQLSLEQHIKSPELASSLQAEGKLSQLFISPSKA